MTQDRVFTVQRYDLVPPGSPNHGCRTVVLKLVDNGGFTLLVATYSSDWGDRHEKSELFAGTYEDRDGGIVCHADRRHVSERHADHELGTEADEQRDEASSEVFAFKRRAEGGLICPIDHDGLRGVLMSAHLAPHPGVF